MIRFAMRTALLGAMALGSAAAVFGPEQVRHWAENGKQTVEQKLKQCHTLENDLNQIRAKVASLDQEILELKEKTLSETVQIEGLQQEIQDRSAGVESLRENLERAEALLDGNLLQFRIRGLTYSREEIEADVQEKMHLYQVQRDTLRQLRETLEVRTGALALLQENTQRGESLREELQGKVRLLEAGLEKFRAREAYAEAVTTDFDAQEFSTEIGDARQALAHFEQKLEVKNRMLDERLKITAEHGSVAGIDYTAPAEKTASLKQDLRKVLGGEEISTVKVAEVTSSR